MQRLESLVKQICFDADYYPRCPEPEVLRLLHCLVLLTKPRTILEIGTLKGAATLYMAQALEQIGHGKIITVDIHDHASANFKRSGLASLIEQIIGSSQEVLPRLNRKIEMAFVDTVHEYHQVMIEFGYIDAILAPNGFIVFHDSIAWAGVGQAVQEIQNLPNYESLTLPTPPHAQREAHRDLPSGVSIVRKMAPFKSDIVLHRVSAQEERRNELTQFAVNFPKALSLRAPPLSLGLVKGENYGWGVCSRYLINELSKLRAVAVLNPDDSSSENPSLPGVLFQALTNVDFDPMFPKAWAERNFGYTFFENELTARSIENAKRYDKVLGGSTWCLERMREKGILNCTVLVQGIDPELFYPIEDPTDPERFVIFSGGKFELRKGQDLVLRAVKIMQDKYPDVWLVNSWYNLWPASTRLMGYSPHIRFEHRDNERWTDTMARTYAANGLDSSRIVTCELMPQNLQRELYSRSDIGLFPNRCEGGTNLVLMEYMACAKPVIASNTSGHRDIVNEGNAILLNRLAPFNIADSKGEVIARWQDPSLDEIVAHLEHAYHHRQENRQIGMQAGIDLKNFTWARSAQRLLQIIEAQV